MSERFNAGALRTFATTVLRRVGMEEAKADAVAEIWRRAIPWATPRTGSSCSRSI